MVKCRTSPMRAQTLWFSSRQTLIFSAAGSKAIALDRINLVKRVTQQHRGGHKQLLQRQSKARQGETPWVRCRVCKPVTQLLSTGLEVTRLRSDPLTRSVPRGTGSQQAQGVKQPFLRWLMERGSCRGFQTALSSLACGKTRSEFY